MNPKYLAQLATIVELGSVTKAAQKLNTTQPTLSRTIKLIEDRVGAPILRRGRHGVTATEIGFRLAESQGERYCAGLNRPKQPYESGKMDKLAKLG